LLKKEERPEFKESIQSRSWFGRTRHPFDYLGKEKGKEGQSFRGASDQGGKAVPGGCHMGGRGVEGGGDFCKTGFGEDLGRQLKDKKNNNEGGRKDYG